MAPSQTGSRFLTLERFFNFFCSKKHFYVDQILQRKNIIWETAQASYLLHRKSGDAPQSRFVWLAWLRCCNSRSVVNAPPSCGPYASSSKRWRWLADHCCVPSGALCAACIIWRSRLLLGWTQLPIRYETISLFSASGTNVVIFNLFKMILAYLSLEGAELLNHPIQERYYGIHHWKATKRFL